MDSMLDTGDLVDSSFLSITCQTISFGGALPRRLHPFKIPADNCLAFHLILLNSIRHRGSRGGDTMGAPFCGSFVIASLCHSPLCVPIPPIEFHIRRKITRHEKGIKRIYMVERQMCVYTVWFAWKAFIYFCVSSRPVDTGECLGRMIDCARVWARSHLFVKASLIRSGAADKQIIDVAMLYIHTAI